MMSPEDSILYLYPYLHLYLFPNLSQTLSLKYHLSEPQNLKTLYLNPVIQTPQKPVDL